MVENKSWKQKSHKTKSEIFVGFVAHCNAEGFLWFVSLFWVFFFECHIPVTFPLPIVITTSKEYPFNLTLL